MIANRSFHLHLISDSTGETIHSIARACIAQFPDSQPIEHFWNLVRTRRQLDMVIEAIRDNPGLIVFSIVDHELRRTLEDVARSLNLPHVAVLDPVLKVLANYLGQESQAEPGRQHALDAAYFGRMDALDFALQHDDGQSPWDLHKADVILIGVSRCSKTPTCLYLGNRGIKAANIPLVPGAPLPAELDQITRPLIVGLTKDPERLIQIRRQRLRLLNQDGESDYIDIDAVRREVIEARRLCAQRGWPVIDVTRRSVEETSAEIMMMMAQRVPGAARPDVY